MKHFVFVVGNYKNGGVPMRSTNLANAFAEKGYYSTILVTKDIADNVFFKLHKNVELVSLKEYIKTHSDDVDVILNSEKRAKKIHKLKRLRYLLKFNKAWDKKLETQIKELRRGEAISVYMANHRESIYISFGISYFEQVFCAAKDLGCKLIYAERNAPELEFPANEFHKKYFLEMVSCANGAILQTKDEYKFFDGYLTNAKVINNPVKADLPEPFSGERRKVIVNFCRIAKQKNIPLMIEAFIKLHKEYPEYVLEIYGNTVGKIEEELLAEYKNLVKEFGADNYIKFLPPRADVHNVIRDAMMFVSSSDFEGLSNSMIEAMAIGLPCVCTDCLGGGAREMITDGENGLLVPVNDTEKLYSAMKRMIDDNELRTKCSHNAAKVRQQLSVSHIAEKWLDFINNVT